MSHWHVQRHNEDDDVYAVEDLAYALNYAATELERVADFEHDGITANGEAGDFEEAYRAFQRAETYAGLAANATNLYRQATLPLAERAPLYRDGNPEVWRKSADHVVDQINGDGPNGFEIWECSY